MDPAQPQECQTLARFPPIPLLPPRINKKKGNEEWDLGMLTLK